MKRNVCLWNKIHCHEYSKERARMQHTIEVHTQAAAGSLFLRQTGERSHSVNLHQLKETKDSFLEQEHN